MTTICWFESFSEEEETVKQVSDRHPDIHFFEGPVQNIESGKLPDQVIYTIRTHSKFKQVHLDRAECIISRSTGYDHLLEVSDTCNIPIGYLNEYATTAVAEQNLTLALALTKRIPNQMQAMDTFNRNNLTTYDLKNRIPGIVGVGRIGRATAELLLDLGYSVYGHDPVKKSRLSASERFTYCSIEKLFKKCNTIFLCLPHTSETEFLISNSLLDSLPHESILINTGRGEVVRNKDLLSAISNGNLTGLALDVFNEEDKISKLLQTDATESEPENAEVSAGLELIRRDDVIATPHNAFNSREALKKKVKLTLDNIDHYEENGTLINSID